MVHLNKRIKSKTEVKKGGAWKRCPCTKLVFFKYTSLHKYLSDLMLVQLSSLASGKCQWISQKSYSNAIRL